MDKFRWSNGHSHAVEFLAQSDGFVTPALAALRQFHGDTAKKYHDGAAQTNRVSFRSAQLHLQIGHNWRHLKQGGALVIFPVEIEDSPLSIDDMYERLETELFFKSSMIWDRVAAVHKNEASLQQFLTGFSDTLREMVGNDE